MGQPVTFRRRAVGEMGTPKPAAVGRAARRFMGKRQWAIDDFTPMEETRDRARMIRLHTLANLHRYLGQFADSVERNGGTVLWAADAAEANRLISEVVGRKEGSLVIKSKSMVTEELDLNAHLQGDGHTVVETDLGEFIVQLAEDHPSHIIAPVMHLTRQDIGELFHKRLEIPYTDDPEELNAVARRHLRRFFLSADVGISGVNTGVAETGSIITVTNEGNGWLTTAAPRTHIAVMGMERLVPTFADAATIVEVLARSATGQRLSVYTNVVSGPRRPGDPDGPDEFVVVIVDNGRSRVLSTDASEILACIRCGACLNVCPVFREVGGHAYGQVYPGPVGSVLAPGLADFTEAADLPFASSLCGACREVCPVRIDIPKLLVHQRVRAIRENDPFRWLGPGLKLYGQAAKRPRVWKSLLAAGRVAGRMKGRDEWFHRLPFHAKGWTQSRDFPAPARQSFRQWWKENRDGT
ncbi:MAG: LutB/LldF family L-lactate oxidation iron-sulfur protein [bacterium]|nr:LutB/LldF family L-lactate oxidation iron-sulfur protein [bacterium]